MWVRGRDPRGEIARWAKKRGKPLGSRAGLRPALKS